MEALSSGSTLGGGRGVQGSLREMGKFSQGRRKRGVMEYIPF